MCSSTAAQCNNSSALIQSPENPLSGHECRSHKHAPSWYHKGIHGRASLWQCPNLMVRFAYVMTFGSWPLFPASTHTHFTHRHSWTDWGKALLIITHILNKGYCWKPNKNSLYNWPGPLAVPSTFGLPQLLSSGSWKSYCKTTIHTPLQPWTSFTRVAGRIIY